MNKEILGDESDYDHWKTTDPDDRPVDEDFDDEDRERDRRIDRDYDDRG